jgi:hypothetical protein
MFICFIFYLLAKIQPTAGFALCQDAWKGAALFTRLRV